MTDASRGAPEPQKIGANTILLSLVALIVIAAFGYVLSQRKPELRTSPVGMDGLRIWLTSEGQDAQSFLGGWPLVADEIGLLIVPIYDTALEEDRTPPTTKEELISQQDEYDLDLRTVQAKARRVPTLVVLPKWRSGMRLTRIAHPILRADTRRIARLGDDLINGNGFEIKNARRPFLRLGYDGPDGARRNATIYAAQLFSAPQCRPIIGDEDGMILGECPLAVTDEQRTAFVLSDPDLLNNHGLTLGDNAFIARDVVDDIARPGRIIVDYSSSNWLVSGAEASTRERTWADLLRFFSPPFTLIWVGVAIAFALLLWRSGVRFGPLLPAPAIGGASKTMAIAARARLMLLSGRDGALARDYMRARLAATASQLFGHAHARQLAGPDAFLAYTKRRHPALSSKLAESLNAIESLPAAATSRHALATLNDLDDVLEQITNDTRGTKRAS